MARFNTQPITGSITAGSTLAGLTQNAFIQLTGTAPYTVTLPSPVLYPGFNQTFYNATSGTITLNTPAGNFVGAGGSGTANVTVPTTSTINLVSDGVNYVVVGEDGTSLTATTGLFSGNVTINGAGATLSVTPQTVTINPGGSSTIDNINIGATTRGSGAFTSLAANAAVTFTANTASSTTGTGTVVVTGGIGVSGNINSGGTVAAVALSGPLTGTIQTAAQANITSVGTLTGLTISGDIYGGSASVNTLILRSTSGNSNRSAISIGNVLNSDNGGISFSTAGASVETVQMRISGTTGNVGIGTTTPGELLHISSTGETSLRLASTYASGKAYNITSGGNGNYSPGVFAIRDVTAGTTPFSIFNNNVGIGTTSPNTKLSVVFVASGGTSIGIQHTNLAQLLAIGWNDSVDYTFIHTSNGVRPLILQHTGGNVGIGTATPAYKLHVAGTSGTDDPRITPINSSVAVTATKVFVYDTRKDSDGGAWRKRTQHTSWYNETLNTATRGSRKEFPAVAIIVAFTGKVQIYDADDPTLPLWIEFNNSTLLQDNTTSVCMMNGLLVWGNRHTNSAYAQNNLVTCDFISETAKRVSHAGNTYGGTNTTGIVDRNTWDNQASWVQGNPYTLSNYYINDVAITVLPNAPIDPATGLPTPTIAVATNAGINVIHNNGLVNSINATDAVEYNYWRSVSFTKDYKLIINSTYLGASNNIVHVCDIPYVTFSGNLVNTRIVALNSRYYHSDSMTPNLKPGIDLARIASTGINTLAIGGTGAVGVTLVAEAPETVVGVNSSAMVAYVLPTYNTGWMVGDIKGAWCCDTTVETITGAELITNGTFTTNTTGWTANTASGTGHTFTATGGVMSVARAAGKGIGFGEPYQALTVEVNKQYVVSVDVGTTPMSLNITSAVGGGTTYYAANLPVGRSVISFTPGVTTVYFLFIPDSAGTTSTVDNVSVRKAELDRSVNNRGLQIYGSITKAVVNTGNDLVAYSGWSSSNYLYVPSIPFTLNNSYQGHIGFWSKPSSSNNLAMGCGFGGVYDSTAGVFGVTSGWTSSWADRGSNVGGGFSDIKDNTLVPNVWQKVDLVSNYGTTSIYVNGRLVESASFTYTISNPTFWIGAGNSAGNGGAGAFSGPIALARLTQTAPSAEQILKMYNDESRLFQIGAKGCIYGSSAVITSIAFDDDTNLLHVGTSSGRSVFNGLRRVDNTATAVSASISASNGLVAEQ